MLKFLPSLFHQNCQNISPLLSFSENTNLPNIRHCSCNDSAEQNKNLSAVLHGKTDLRMENRPIPKHGANQVLLQMEVVGICGSDVHFYLDGKLGPFVVKSPMVIGHEGSGTVLECGEDVVNLKPGDKVAIEPQMSCKKCNFCKSGNYHLCPDIYFCATPPDDGNLSRYYVHDADFCHKLPCSLDFEHGTLMEPLAVGVHACKRAEVSCGDSVLIIGSGPIGLVSLLAARAYGASRTLVLDIDDFKIQKALQLGADCAINVKGCEDKAIVKSIHDIFGHHPHKTIECCGFEKTFRIGMEATRSGGKMALVGMATDKAHLPIGECIFREVDLLGVFRYANDYPTAIKMVESGIFDPKPLITHHFKLEDAKKAFETASGKKESFIKIMIHANPKWQPLNKEKC
ncbi:unnamed protein product [Ceutorhynchus assimilis]|uniref:Sorbitol dehydrogenase n=1 Tax=Ceutorhynchus assimilis TaxID=467358 RepID=A0A9N9MPU9_9CUCU|nr:unnamed protein product [Ceutorhynchus assimilis]